MSRVRFHAGDIDLELSGSEPFVLRQLKLLATYLRGVDGDALGEAEPIPPVEQAAAEEPAPVAAPAAAAPPEILAPAAPVEPEPAAPPLDGGPAPAPAKPLNGGSDTADELLRFYGGFRPQDLDRQSDAALLFAYYLQQREGQPSLQLGDLIRCCIRAGVDTRNFNRTLGILTRRGYLETVRHGHAYRLSEHGVAAVESRM